MVVVDGGAGVNGRVHLWLRYWYVDEVLLRTGDRWAILNHVTSARSDIWLSGHARLLATFRPGTIAGVV